MDSATLDKAIKVRNKLGNQNERYREFEYAFGQTKQSKDRYDKEKMLKVLEEYGQPTEILQALQVVRVRMEAEVAETRKELKAI